MDQTDRIQRLIFLDEEIPRLTRKLQEVTDSLYSKRSKLDRAVVRGRISELGLAVVESLQSEIKRIQEELEKLLTEQTRLTVLPPIE
jgi:hypothetical protein